MVQRFGLYVAVAVAAGVGFAAGVNLDRISDLMREARAYASDSFARPIELVIWAQGSRRLKDPEPIVSPADAASLVQACVGAPEAIYSCTERRAKLVATIRNFSSEPAGMREVALCLTDGCDGLMPVAPANACFWWTLFLDVFDKRATGTDDTLARHACGRADFGSTERRNALANLWAARIKDKSWLTQSP